METSFHGQMGFHGQMLFSRPNPTKFSRSHFFFTAKRCVFTVNGFSQPPNRRQALQPKFEWLKDSMLFHGHIFFHGDSGPFAIKSPKDLWAQNLRSNRGLGMKKSNKNGRLPSCTFGITRFALVPSVLTWQWLFEALILTTWLHRMQLMGPKLFMHVAGRPRMVPTVSRGMSSLMSVMVKTSMMTLLPLPLTLFLTARTGMTTTLWATNFARRGAGHLVLLHFLVEFDI